MKLFTIETEYFKLDGGAMYGVVPKVMWQKLNPPDANNLCSWAMRCLLIEDGNQLILVDTGIGNKQDAKFLSHYHLHGNHTLEKSLAEHGFHKNDITDVILTHLHFDHCGGAIERNGESLVPAFKNATYWSTQQHWQNAVQPNQREKASFLKENILPIEQSGQLKFIENPVGENSGSVIANTRFSNDISINFVSGHTIDMMLPQINYKGRTIVYMADLLPSASHIPLPYVMAYDMQPLKTLNEKAAFLQTAVENDYILFFEHDPLIECCTLQQTEKGVRYAETFALNTL